MEKLEPTETVELTMDQLFCSQVIPESLAKDFSGVRITETLWFRPTTQAARVSNMTMLIACQTLENITHKYPENWLQAVKDRFAPAWIKRRRPVKYITMRLEAKALYPKIKIPKASPIVVLRKKELGEYD